MRLLMQPHERRITAGCAVKYTHTQFVSKTERWWSLKVIWDAQGKDDSKKLECASQYGATEE